MGTNASQPSLAKCLIWALSLVALFWGQVPVSANPANAQVVRGSVRIDSSTAGYLKILQDSDKAILDWGSFSIAPGETTQFIQPNELSAILNRVRGADPSMLDGVLKANGRVFLLNPNGVIVGQSGRIDAGGFVASTLDLDNDNFWNGGDLSFQGNTDASVINLGEIGASDGDVFLIGASVLNQGRIRAPEGTVGLAAGNDVLIASSGNEHVFVRGASGDRKGTGVDNRGVIEANLAELKAHGGNHYALAIRNEGRVAATGVTRSGGQILLRANGGRIESSGELRARRAGGQGGQIRLEAGPGPQSTAEISGVIDAAGEVGDGGDIAITATGLSVTPGSKITSAAGSIGSGGQVWLIAEDRLDFHGTVSAAGGELGGDGGFIDLSGKRDLLMDSLARQVDLSARLGRSGTLLYDPINISIIAGTGNPNNPNTLVADDIAAHLQTANLIVTTSVTGGDEGTIKVIGPANITWSSASSLTFLADYDFVMGPGSVISATGAGALGVTAKRSISLEAGSVIETFDGNLTLSANQQTSAMTNSFTGISIDGAKVEVKGTGGLSLWGRGGNTGEANFGIHLKNGARVIGGSSGISQVTGVGGASSGFDSIGVQVAGIDSQISSRGSNVVLTGTGGGFSATAGGHTGVRISSGGVVTSGPGSGVSVQGTGGTGGGDNRGIWIDVGGLITSGGGSVVLEGSAGGTVTPANNSGVEVAGSLSTGGGGLTVIGTADANPLSQAIRLSGTISTPGNQSIALIGDSFQSTGGTINSGTGITSIRPRTNGLAIDLGGADAVGVALGLTDAELDRITAGSVAIGTETSGAITISNTITHGNDLLLYTGAGLSVAGPVTMNPDRNLSITAAGAISVANNISTLGAGSLTLFAERNITLGSGSALTTVDGNVTLNANRSGGSSTTLAGVDLDDARIQSFGTGSITLEGRGGASGNSQHGVSLRNGARIIGGSSGLVSLTGFGGTSTGTANHGISLTGNTTFIESLGANVELTGTAGSGVGSEGIQITGSIRAQAGALTLTTDTLTLGGDLTGFGPLNLLPQTTAASIGLGNAGSETLNLTTTELAHIRDGFGSITIGHEGRGTIAAGAATFSDPITLRGASITVNGQITGVGNAGITLIGPSTLSAGLVTSGHPINVLGDVILGGGVTLDTTNTGGSPGGANVNIEGSLDGNGPDSDFAIDAGAGTIQILDQIGGNTPVRNLGFRASGLVLPQATTASGDISILVDTLNNPFTSTGTISSPGVLTIAPRTMGRSIGMAGATGDLQLDASGIGFSNNGGFTAIRIGNPQTGVIRLGAATFFDPVTFTGSRIDILGPLIGADDASISLLGQTTLNAPILTHGNDVFLQNGLTVGILGTAPPGLIDTTANSNPGGATITINGPIDADLASQQRDLSLNAGSGGVLQIGGAIGGSQMLRHLDFKSSQLNLFGNVAVLGNVSILTDTITIGGLVSGLGDLLIAPQGSLTPMAIGNLPSNGLHLDGQELGKIQNGFASLRFGNADTSTLTLGSAVYQDSAIFSAESIRVVGGGLTGDGATLTFTGPTELEANLVTKGNAVTFEEAVALSQDVQIDTTANGSVPGGAEVTALAPIDGLTTARRLKIRAGLEGSIDLQGAIGSNNLIDDLALRANRITLGSTVRVRNNISVLAGGDIDLRGVTASGIEVIGSPESDTIFLDVAPSRLAINGGSGTDTVTFASAQAGLSTRVTSYTNIENLIGSRFPDTLVGSPGDDVFTVGQNNSGIISYPIGTQQENSRVFMGFSSFESLRGGPGDDLFQFRNQASVDIGVFGDEHTLRDSLSIDDSNLVSDQIYTITANSVKRNPVYPFGGIESLLLRAGSGQDEVDTDFYRFTQAINGGPGEDILRIAGAGNTTSPITQIGSGSVTYADVEKVVGRNDLVDRNGLVNVGNLLQNTATNGAMVLAQNTAAAPNNDAVDTFTGPAGGNPGGGVSGDPAMGIGGQGDQEAGSLPDANSSPQASPSVTQSNSGGVIGAVSMAGGGVSFQGQSEINQHLSVGSEMELNAAIGRGNVGTADGNDGVVSVSGAGAAAPATEQALVQGTDATAAGELLGALGENVVALGGDGALAMGHVTPPAPTTLQEIKNQTSPTAYSDLSQAIGGDGTARVNPGSGILDLMLNGTAPGAAGAASLGENLNALTQTELEGALNGP